MAWVNLAVLPVSRSELTANYMTYGAIHALGGRDSTGAYTRSHYAYDIATNTWSSKALYPLTGGLAYHCAEVVNGLLCVTCGISAGSVTLATYLYYPALNTWNVSTSIPSISQTSIVGSVSYGGLMYVFGSTATRAFDPNSQTWITKRAQPTSRNTTTATLGVDNKVYLTGGSSTRNDRYDPVTDLWSVAPSLPGTNVSFHGWVSVGRFTYAVGGLGGGTTPITTNTAFDPFLGTFTAKTTLGVAKYAFGATAGPAGLYIVAGRTSTSTFAVTNVTQVFEREPIPNAQGSAIGKGVVIQGPRGEGRAMGEGIISLANPAEISYSGKVLTLGAIAIK